MSFGLDRRDDFIGFFGFSYEYHKIQFIAVLWADS